MLNTYDKMSYVYLNLEALIDDVYITTGEEYSQLEKRSVEFMISHIDEDNN